MQPPDDVKAEGRERHDTPGNEKHGREEISQPFLPAFSPAEKPDRMDRPEQTQQKKKASVEQFSRSLRFHHTVLAEKNKAPGPEKWRPAEKNI